MRSSSGSSSLTSRLGTLLCKVARWKIRSLHGRHIVELTTAMGQYVRYMTFQAVDTALDRLHAILSRNPPLTQGLEIYMLCEVAWWKIRSLHGRHIVELTTPMGQYVRCMTLQAVDTALDRSYSILKSQLTTSSLEICN